MRLLKNINIDRFNQLNLCINLSKLQINTVILTVNNEETGRLVYNVHAFADPKFPIKLANKCLQFHLITQLQLH